MQVRPFLVLVTTKLSFLALPLVMRLSIFSMAERTEKGCCTRFMITFSTNPSRSGCASSFRRGQRRPRADFMIDCLGLIRD